MTPRFASLVTLLRLASILLVGAACTTSTSYRAPSASMTTLMAGWERHFAVEWTTEPERAGARRVVGHLTGLQGEMAEPVRVLAQALDSSGAIVGQRINWVIGGVNGFQRAYFEIPDLPSAAQYRVTVWEYNFQQSPGAGWI